MMVEINTLLDERYRWQKDGVWEEEELPATIRRMVKLGRWCDFTKTIILKNSSSASAARDLVRTPASASSRSSHSHMAVLAIFAWENRS